MQKLLLLAPCILKIHIFLSTATVRKSIFAGMCPAGSARGHGGLWAGTPPRAPGLGDKSLRPTHPTVSSSSDGRHGDIKLQLNRRRGAEGSKEKGEKHLLREKPGTGARLLHAAEGKTPRCDGRTPSLTGQHVQRRSDETCLLNKEFPRQRIKIIANRKAFESLRVFHRADLMLLICASKKISPTPEFYMKTEKYG